ncbi:SDR family NAD(P)-dependent oxidoreductase [Streptomyces sp. NPDC048191]|uniref:SDR family NAD(P)-dependent oxidoreductase n=1 Tax=Streptomyces sp. NPDC048191 TaxID=3155484 RepID=UPI0033E186B5
MTTTAGVRSWLVSAVAEAAGIDRTSVDQDRPLAEFGLGSRQLVALAAGLTAHAGVRLEPALLFEHPTIDAIARALFPPSPSPEPSTAPAACGAASRNEVAIVSMACRYPGGADAPDALWQVLDAGTDVIREVPPGRWDTRGLHDPDPKTTGKAYSLRGGFLDGGIDRFDAAFFGISPREAAAMDPQQRILLQTAWEAFERAGVLPETLNGSRTGVYLGLYDSGYLASASLDQLDGHVGTGSAGSVASGRIAYWFGLRGPAVTIDTACSSSLVALHLAARALAGRECDLALAGGATLLVTPRGHVEFSRLRGLSPSGRCRPFSASADGVVWAEGCGLVLLKRLDDARRDGDRILAVIKGSAVNQDGRSQGLSAPSGKAQERLLRAALEAAGLTAQDLDHVEAHGTGTPLGDPIELRALAKVFGPGRSTDRPLGVGSLKSNIGHTQAAAGVGGVIKTVLALVHERVPASLHADDPTDHIDWGSSGLQVRTDAKTWPRDAARVRRAGVSAFGISGTNAHVILEEAPEPPARPTTTGDQVPKLFPLSGRSRPSLKRQAARLRDALEANPDLPLSAVASTLAHHRSHFGHRAVLRPIDRPGLLAALKDLADGRPDPEQTTGPHETRPTGKVAFVFPGQGAQWTGMARDLLDRDPVFAAELDRCDATLRRFTQWSVAAVLRGDEGSPSMDRVDVVQPVLFAVMVSLAAVWRARGVEPDAVIGHSQGEVAAACVAGALSLDDAAAVVAVRSRALTGLAGTGTMAVIALPHTDVSALLDGNVSVAAVNSGRATVVAGTAESVQSLLARLEARQVFVRGLEVDYASHSAQVEPVREEIVGGLDGVVTSPADIAWYSTVTSAPVTGELTADYWYTNLREPVRFAATAERMLADGYRHFVELSPHPSLLTALRTIGEESDHDLIAIESLRRDEDGPACLTMALAELHARGGRIDWHALITDCGTVDLPTYAWDEQSYWVEPARSSSLPALFDRAAHPLLGVQLQSADETRWTFRGEWFADTADWLADHRVFRRTVVSGTTLLELCRAAIAVARPDAPLDVTDLLLLSSLVLPESGSVEVSVEVSTAGSAPEITVHSRRRSREDACWTLHATASAADSTLLAEDEPPVWPEDAEEVWTAQTYERLTALGLSYGPAFQGVRSVVSTGEGELLARLSLPSIISDVSDAYPLHPSLLDAALQVAAAFNLTDGRVLLPVAVGRCTTAACPAGDVTARVRKTSGSASELTLEVTLWDADGFPAGRLVDVRLRAASPADLDGGLESARHMYEVSWTPVAPSGRQAPDIAWAVTGDAADPQIADALDRPVQREMGADVVVRLWPRAQPDADPAATAHEQASEALAELQALIARAAEQVSARTIWVTRGAVAAAAGDCVDGYAQSVLWGLARSARAEHPNLGLTLLDLDDSDPVSALTTAVQLSDEPELAVREGEMFAPRLVRARVGDTVHIPHEAAYELTGLPDRPHPIPLAPLQLAGGQVRIQVEALALSAPDNHLACAGVVCEVAPDVVDVAYGQRVLAVADHASCSQVVVAAADVVPLPDTMPCTTAVAELTDTEAHEPAARVFPVSATRTALRRAAVTSRPIVLDLIGAPTSVPTDGTVLITGGLGAIGRHIATVLADNGVRRMVLTARKGPEDARAAGAVTELRALGADATVVACDVTDPASVAIALAHVDGEHPLRGVVHCAGILDDGVIAELTQERLARVLRPKVDGAVHLHRLTARAQLDLFLLVSSAAGVVGNAGQGNYAAANAFLDQLAHHRHARGLAGTSVSFGAWEGAGLAASADLDRMARRGYRALTPREGGDLVAMVLRQDAPHLVAWALDLQRLRTGDAAGSALWRSLMPVSDSAKHEVSLADRLARLPAAQRAERLTALVREEVSRALGLRSTDHVRTDQPLRDLGMDSVTAVELRNRIGARLGAKLPATLLFDYPTTAKLSSHLLSTVLGRTPDPSAGVIRSGPVDASRSDEPIAIVAMACRLPGGVSEPDDLWRLVAEGRDAIGPFPDARWDVESLYDPDPDALGKSYTREGGFLDDIESFDPSFFGITPREAAAMDPQQRLLLETSWEALERAGIVPAQLAGSSTGVYVGMFGSGYLAGPALDQLDGYVGTGSALSVASGRLAYALGLHGPALTVDTACSSSLVATHLAAQALRAGECDLALAGGVTLMVTPQTFVEFSRLRGLSPTGRCRSFSDDADGAVWAEGAGMLVLKRLSDAQRDGDKVLAVLRGTAVNQDGHSQGLSAPNGPAQEQVIRRALKQSGITPSEIDYVEAHGTGTTLGDPIEAGALGRVFGNSRPHGRPLHLGSLKSNIGHTQAASGVCGLIKVVLSLRNQSLPRTLHAGTPSRHVDWEGSGLRLLQEAVAWPVTKERTRRAGVSAFGISGTNAHVIVEEAPQQAVADGGPAPDGRQLFVLSARSEAALRAQAGRLARRAVAGVSLPDLAHTLARHRSHFEWRTALVTNDQNELLSSLEALSSGRRPVNKPREEQSGKVAFVFPGHGGHWPGMERDMLSQSEAFRTEMTRIDQAVRRWAGWSVLDTLRAPDESSWLARTERLQPVLFALNASVAAAWRELGVAADAVVGHSLGEIAAAYSAGALTLDEAVTVVTSRAEAVAPLVGCGGMLAVHLPLADLEELLTSYTDRLFIGAVNSSADTAVSGRADALAEFHAQLTERGVTARILSTPFASHTPLMDPLRTQFLDRLSDVRSSRTPTTVYSSLRAETIPGDHLDAEYWFANLRQPVRFADTIRRMLDDGYRYFVELSPHPSLLSSIEAVAADAGIDAVGVGSLRRGQACPDALLERVGELYTAGHTPTWPALFPQGRRLDLPTYPFVRERHWLAPMHTASTAGSPLLGTHIQPSDEPGRNIFESEIDLSASHHSYLMDHKVAGQVWMPGAAFLEMALEAAASVLGDGPAELADVRFLQPLHLDPDHPVRLQLVLRPTEDSFRDFTIASAATGERSPTWQQHVTGRIAVAPETLTEHGVGLSELRERCSEPVDLSALYAGFAALGLDYGTAFRGLAEGHQSACSAVVRLTARPSAGHLMHPATLDAAFHSAAMPAQAPGQRAFVPAEVGRVRHRGLHTAPAWASCDLLSVDGDCATLDLRLWDDSGRVVLEAKDLRLAALSPLNDALFETRWHPRPMAQEPAPEGSWLIVADETGIARDLSDRLDGLAPYVLARRGETYAAEGPNRYVLDTADPAQLGRLLDEAFADALPVRVVQLSALDAPAIIDARTAEAATHLSCLTTVHLVRAITSRAQGRAPRLFVVVRGSQAAGDSSAVAHPQQALAWGLGLAVAQEHPEVALTLVDLPADAGADMLWTQLWHADDERMIALRDASRFVPRLARTRPDTGSEIDRADGVHLITGGLGGIGRVIAERLVRRGVRRLALMGRSTPDETAAAWISGLEQRGVTVHVARTDVADRAGLSAALEAVRREVGPVTRIVHAAGVLEDATLANLTEESIRRVLAPKVLGTVLLTELVPEADDLVLFASVAGLVGSAGQSAYSAANAFLDAWGHHLVHAGRRALSLDWGAWADAGMAAESGRAAQTNRSGLAALSPQDGGELFDRVLTSSRRQLAPVAFDWNRLALDRDAVRSRPLLAELLVPRAEGTDDDGTVHRVFAATGEEERSEALERYVRTRVAAVSGAPVDVSGTTALQDLGLDSLMLVRLRNSFARDLGTDLAVTDIFAAKDIRGLVRLLAVSLPEDGSQGRGTSVGPDRAVPPTELRPATRDVVRLLRSARPGMPDAAHSIGLALRLATPTSPKSLGGILDRLAARHAALRTAIVNGPEGGRLLRVDREPAMPLLLWTEVTGPNAAERLRLLLERPYCLAQGPLWRFELIDGGPEGQFLVFGAHHAVSDLQSLLVVAAEIDAELSGTVLDGTPTNRDIDLLVSAQQSGEESFGNDWRTAFHGSKRLDLTLARPRPEIRSYRSDSVTVAIPGGLMERVSATAGSLGITPAAFCLGTLTVLLARRQECEQFVLAVPVDTRIHVDADGAVGFFGVPVPFPAMAVASESVADVLLRTDSRLRRILSKGAMFTDVLSTLARQGLYRSNAPLVEVYFNYVRFAGRLANLEVLPTGAGHTDLDLMITMTPDTGTVCLDHNTDVLDTDTVTALGEDFLRLLEHTTGNTMDPVREAHGTNRLEECAEGPRLALAATFALGDLPAMCEAALETERAAVAEAPYHQVLAALQNPSGVFADPATAMSVVLLRAADLERFGPMDDALLAELTITYSAALREYAARTPLIVGILPTCGSPERLQAWERTLAADLAGAPGIAVLGPDRWAWDHTGADCFDDVTDKLAHLPFTPDFQAAIALRLAEVVRAARRPAPKVIAVDGDETLWGGVAGEIGPEAVDLAGSRALLASRLLQWRDAGTLLVLLSNNDEETVRAVLDRPDSRLRVEHFSVLSASWGPKPVRLAQAARTLNLGLDSFLFLDDNPAEIAKMRSQHPQVLSVTCPQGPELDPFLHRLWPLVPAATTDEDSLRARFYEQEYERDTARANSGFEEFLSDLELNVDIRSLAPAHIQRSEQLIRRTNQFVLRMRSDDDLARWQEQGEVWTATARDRFGDYGQIALLAFHSKGGLLDVVAWTMSCRALGRGIEEQLLGWLADRAEEFGCTKVRFTAERTPRNAPARRLIAALGGGDPDDERLDVQVTPEELRTFRSWKQP